MNCMLIGTEVSVAVIASPSCEFSPGLDLPRLPSEHLGSLVAKSIDRAS